MNCPYCQHAQTKVIDSRYLMEKNSVKRRRRCESCEKRFTTFETVELELPLVIKRDGRREPFRREKITSGISKACQKRPIGVATIEHIVESVMKSILEISDKEVAAREVGKLVMEHLRALDPVAYVRFASVYKDFTDIQEFFHELKESDLCKNLFASQEQRGQQEQIEQGQGSPL